jgi:hypothetical protein
MIIFLRNRNRYKYNVLATEMIFVYKRGCAITAGAKKGKAGSTNYKFLKYK